MKQSFIIGMLPFMAAILLTGCTSVADRILPDQDPELNPDNKKVVAQTTNNREAVADEVVGRGANRNDVENKKTEEDIEADYIKYNIIHDAENEFSDDETYTLLITEECGYIELTDGDKYPNLKVSLDKMNAERKDAKEAFVAENLETAKECLNEYKETGYDMTYYMPLYRNCYDSVVRADSKVFSICVSESSYAGGVHGWYGWSGINYDSQTGKQLTITDVVTDVKLLPDVIYQKLIADYPDIQFICDSPKYFEQQYLNGTDTSMDYSFTIENDGIILYFNPYELASYADGAQQIFLKYDEYPDLLAGEYFTNKSQGIVMFDAGAGLYKDFDNDGNIDKLNVYCYNEDSGYAGSYKICVNNQEIVNSDEVGFEAYLVDYYYLEKGERKFIYIYSIGMNDYTFIHSYELVGTTPVLVEAIDGYLNEFFDPNDVTMTKHTNLLSTYGAYGKYIISDDGKLVLQDRDLTCNSDSFVLTLKQDTEVAVVHPDTGVELEKVTLPTGTKMQIYRTDGEKYVIFKLEDGRTVKVNVVVNDYTYYVNDIDIDELFDGMLYAG